MPQRTFLALDLDSLALDRIEEAQRQLQDPEADLRWVGRDNLHLTLLFLGNVPDERLPAVCDLSAGAAASVSPFEFDVRGFACVPPSGQLRMIWAEVADPTGRLAELQESLRLALAGMGFHEEERRFRPHITLARIKSGRHAAAIRRRVRDCPQTDFGVQYADELVVYGSHLSPDGSTYAPTARLPLGK